MGFFDSLFAKALPMTISDLDYKVSTRESTGFDSDDFAIKMNQIAKGIRSLDGSNRDKVRRGLQSLARNDKLYSEERRQVEAVLDMLRRY